VLGGVGRQRAFQRADRVGGAPSCPSTYHTWQRAWTGVSRFLIWTARRLVRSNVGLKLWSSLPEVMESRRRLKILRSFIAVSVQPKRTVRDNSVVCCQPEISAIRQRALVVRSNSFIPRGMRISGRFISTGISGRRPSGSQRIPAQHLYPHGHGQRSRAAECRRNRRTVSSDAHSQLAPSLLATARHRTSPRSGNRICQ